MEKALLIRIDVAKAHRKSQEAAEQALAELNRHLAAGWKVKAIEPTSGTGTHLSFCIAVLIKD